MTTNKSDKNVEATEVDPDEPAWKSDPTFNKNETQNYVDPEDSEDEDAPTEPSAKSATKPASD